MPGTVLDAGNREVKINKIPIYWNFLSNGGSQAINPDKFEELV